MENIITVYILGKPHTFRTNQKQEEVQSVADIVNRKITDIAKKRNAEPTEAFAMMAALEIAADLYKLQHDYHRLMTLADNNEDD